MKKRSQYLAYPAQRVWFCIKVAFGHWERKALPLEKINSASQMFLPFNYKGPLLCNPHATHWFLSHIYYKGKLCPKLSMLKGTWRPNCKCFSARFNRIHEEVPENIWDLLFNFPILGPGNVNSWAPAAAPRFSSVLEKMKHIQRG